MNRKAVFAIGAVLLLVAILFTSVADPVEADDQTDYLLLDKGNGSTEWIQLEDANTLEGVLSKTLAAAGHTYSKSGSRITIDGLSTTTIGKTDTGGSLSVPGATGTTVTSSWNVYIYDNSEKKWTEVENTGIAYSKGTSLAVGFYPEGSVPLETPSHRSSWTNIGGDATLSNGQTAITNSDDGSVIWSRNDEDNSDYSGVYGSVLYADGYTFVKYGNRTLLKPYDLVECYDSVGNTLWSFKFNNTMYDTSTMGLYSHNIYIQSTDGYLYTFDMVEGPGTDNVNVKTYSGKAMSDTTVTPAPTKISELKGSPYGDGFGSMVFDSGCIFIKHHNGMTYCFDKDLNLIWSYLAGGYNYFLAPTVIDTYVMFGCYDGCLYILDKTSGELITSTVVYQEDTKYVGSVTGINVVKSDGLYHLYFGYNDGKGMSSMNSGYMLMNFNGSTLTKIHDYGTLMGSCGNYGTVVSTEGFVGVYVSGSKGLYRIDLDGNYTCLSKTLISNNITHAGMVLVNETYLYYTTYAKLTHKIFVLNLDGEILKEVDMPVQSYCMSSATVVDGYVFCGTDGGCFCLTAIVDDYHPPVPKSATENANMLLICFVLLVVIVVVLYAFLKYVMKWEHPFSHIRDSFYRFLYGESYNHSTRKKHRLWLIMTCGFLLTLFVAMLSLCIGPETVLGPGEALKNAWSAISKGGRGLTYTEMLIYNSRLPRTLAAFAVGVGLSVAGAIYQAVIKNPLVEPYIMGVSSGAGTLAVAVLLCNFTFFGLFSANSTSLTIISAMVGGLLAFALTMLLAEKTGGKPINYVLSGIIIGLVFSAVQSIMMVSAGNSVSSALSWLYGSFVSMNWDKVWLVLIPCLTLSVAPMIWAKEFNLVLLGEDQAKQMGLDAHKFDMIMLILASVLTAFCVAFCGIIGFVGLVIPHFCRLIVGGDHRLVFPSAIAFGGALMILADVISRAILIGYELPVGAITTVIGVPVFAYLLIRRGKNYD